MLWIDFGFETNGAKDADAAADDDDTTSHGADDADGGLFIHRHASVTTREQCVNTPFVHASRSSLLRGLSLDHPSIHLGRRSTLVV